MIGLKVGGGSGIGAKENARLLANDDLRRVSSRSLSLRGNGWGRALKVELMELCRCGNLCSSSASLSPACSELWIEATSGSHHSFSRSSASSSDMEDRYREDDTLPLRSIMFRRWKPSSASGDGHPRARSELSVSSTSSSGVK